MLTVHDGTSHSKTAPIPTGDIEAHWRLEVWMPIKKAPEDVIARSEKVGGYQEVLARLAAHWPVAGKTTFKVSAAYLLDVAYQKPDDRLLVKPSKVRRGTLSLQLAAALWDVKARNSDARSYVTVTAPSKKTAGISWSGELESELTHDLVTTLDKRVWEAVCPLVTKS